MEDSPDQLMGEQMSKLRPKLAASGVRSPKDVASHRVPLRDQARWSVVTAQIVRRALGRYSRATDLSVSCASLI